MPHLPQDRQLLSELPVHLLLRALPSRLENLDGHLLAAVAAPVQHTERAARDLLHEVQLHLLNLPLAIAGSRERLLALARRRPVARPRLHALVPIHLVQTLLQLLVHGNLVVHPPSGDHEHVQSVAVVRAKHVCLRNVQSDVEQRGRHAAEHPRPVQPRDRYFVHRPRGCGFPAQVLLERVQVEGRPERGSPQPLGRAGRHRHLHVVRRV
mmetsp:Transcript_7737/g.35070  ORF Transcript_7737/g.35070 Transcript_7737/m.35070 type:complete len:210 (+) Transcript_7737:792-1421(+)